jgi:hypothetical protein
LPQPVGPISRMFDFDNSMSVLDEWFSRL